MQISDLDKHYPASFRPLIAILDASSWPSKNIDYFRCSVFPTFFTTFEELVLNIDNVKKEQKIEYRDKFKLFLEEVLSNTLLYRRVRHSNDVSRMTKISVKDVIGLTEKSSHDLFLVDMSVIFLAHDDFGFTIIFHKDHMLPNKIQTLAAKCNLFLLKNTSL